MSKKTSGQLHKLYSDIHIKDIHTDRESIGELGANFKNNWLDARFYTDSVHTEPFDKACAD